MYPGVELRLLRYVTALAQELNFTRAAARLHVAQPSLSKQIRELEEYLGLKLFERTKREVRLTLSGEAFATEARQAILYAERAVNHARAANGHQKGPWTLAYSPLIDVRILSKVRKPLSAAYPAAEIRFVSAHTSEQTDGLLQGKLQAGLVILPLGESGLTCEGLHREALVLALPECHPLASKSEIEIGDLHELPLVTMRGDIEPRFGVDLKRLFGTARIKPCLLHEATTQLEALELASDVGVAALTLSSVRAPLRDNIVIRGFVDEPLTADTGLAYMKESESPMLASLRNFLFDIFQPLTSGRTSDRRARQMELF